MKVRRWLLGVALVCLMLIALPVTALAVEQGYLDGEKGYYSNGTQVYSDVISAGGQLYAFDDNGYMYKAEWGYGDYMRFWLNGKSYGVHSDGTLYVNEWYNSDHYYTADGSGAIDFYKIDGVWYFFDESGWWVNSGYVYSKDYRAWYHLFNYGTDSEEMPMGWYQDEDENWHYFTADGTYPEDFMTIGGKEYYIGYECRMRADEVIWSEKKQAYCALSEDGESFAVLPNAPGWHEALGGWYYAVEEVYGGINYVSGSLITEGDKQYYIKWNGRMAVSEMIDTYDHEASCWKYYLADKDGVLTDDFWWQENTDLWRYYQNARLLEDQVANIGGVWYGFDDWGWMVTDAYFKGYYFDADGKGTYVGENGWFQTPDGRWLYIQEGEPAQGIVTSNGKQYYCEDGFMLEDQLLNVYDDEIHDTKWYYAGRDGVLQSSFWIQQYGDWRYVLNNEYVGSGIYQIGGKWYLFEYSDLVTTTGRVWDSSSGRYYYVTNDDGVLACNQWIQRTICSEYEKGWYYYDSDCQAVEDQVIQIGGVWYGFDYQGKMLADTDAYGFHFDKNGKGTKYADGWNQLPNGKWIYMIDGQMAQGLQEIGGKFYCFDYAGCMVHDTTWTVYRENDEVVYFFGSDGAMITKTGWYHVEGYWIYFNKDHTLYTGWLQDGGKWYYLDPVMNFNTIRYESSEGVTYAFGEDGVAVALKKNGLCSAHGTYVYMVNGKAITNQWKQIGGSWYYFDEYGFAATYGVYEIGGKKYMFSNSELQTGGWISMWGSWYYADPAQDSALRTGYQKIGNNYYIFDDDGLMYWGVTADYNGQKYLLANDGRVLAALEQGWNQVGGNWYYLDGDYLYREDILQDADGKFYYFNADGTMLANGWDPYGDCWADANGVLRSGWWKVNGKWMYAAPGSPYFAKDEFVYENDNQYYLDENGYLVIGTFEHYGTIYTTDADGAIIDQRYQPRNGWYQDGEYWYYYVDDYTYHGWMGDYYFNEWGEMVYNEVVEYNGKHYYLKPDGTLLRGGWYYMINYAFSNSGELSGEWVLARADGSLYCGEWVKQGNTWYYFSGHYMARNGIYTIGEEDHEFDADGKWLGEYTYYDESNYYVPGANGWKQINGKWYYYVSGRAWEGNLYYNGKHYYMQPDMAVSTAAYDLTGDYFYYNADGVRMDYVGWKKLDGNWYFFNQDHSIRTGLVKDGNGWAYVQIHEIYDTVYTAYSELACNEYITVSGQLYYFNASGYSTGPISANGWYQAGADWYYFENGILVRDQMKKIGGTVYSFDYEGRMRTDFMGYYNGKEVVFGHDGAMVTKTGWYQFDSGNWAYVQDGGSICYDGIYIIGGKEYTFCDGVLISE